VIPGHLKVGWRIRFLIGTYVMPLAMGPLLARLDALWQKVAATPPGRTLLQERTAAYPAWRFDGNPNRDYTWHLATDAGGAVLGFVVSRVAKLLAVDAMIVVDVLLAPGVGDGVLRRLLADVRERAVAARCPMLAMMVTQPNPYVPSPSRLGFLAAPYRFSFITRPLASPCRTEDDGLGWHLMWGDTDDS